MTQIAYFSLGATTLTYGIDARSYAGTQGAIINDAASRLGMPDINTAIAGAMAEENDAFGMDDSLLDWYGQHAVTPTDLGAAALTESSILTALASLSLQSFTERTHESFALDYAWVVANNMADSGEIGVVDKALHPTLIDYGKGNFKLATAIRLITEPAYSADVTTLGLDIYKTDYHALARDIINDEQGLTAKLYGLMIKEADTWYKAHHAYGADWGILPREIKDALYITYTNLGRAKMQERYDQITAGASMVSGHPFYEPLPAAGTGGGLNHLQNATAIAVAVGESTFDYGSVSFVSATSQWVQTALQNTAEGQAYREALPKLRPFTVQDGTYDNAGGQLDLYDPASGSGSMSELYIRDRASMLSWKMQFRNAGAIPDVGNAFYKTDYIQNWHFEDETSNLKIILGSAANAQVIVFGSNNADILTGQSKPDHLYGNLGADTLTGGKGSDYLEGGAGTDTYQFAPGDGFDTVLDSDGLGVIRFGAVEAKGSTGLDPQHWAQLPGNVWFDSLNDITYTRSLVDGAARLLIKHGDNTVLVKGWTDSGLGIALGAGEITATHTYTGSTATDLMMNWDGSGWGWDGSRNYAIPGSVNRYQGLGGADFIQTDFTDDLIESGDGNDYVLAQYGGSDQLHGGIGNDYLNIGDPDPANDDGASSASRIPADNRAHVDGGDGNDTITVARGYLPMALAVDGPRAGIVYHLGDVFSDFARAWTNAYIGWERAGTRFYRLTDTPAPTFTGFLRDGVALARNDAGALNLYALFQFPEVLLQGGSAMYAPLFVHDATINNDDSVGHTLFGGAGNDMLEGGFGDDFIEGGADNDALDGERGNDVLFGGSGDDLILGGEGVDWLEGGGGADTLIGEAGSDTMKGGEGDDTYIVDDPVGDELIEVAGEGKDVIIHTANMPIEPSNNGTFARAAGQALETGAPLNIVLPDNFEQLVLEGVGEANGTGNAEDNGLWGNAGNNVLHGAAGNDFLMGNPGDDIYLFNRGDGQDSIDNTDFLRDTGNTDRLAASDTLRLGEGIAESDVLGFQVGMNLVLTLKGSSEQVAVINYFGADVVEGSLVSDQKIDRVEFAPLPGSGQAGTVWDQAMIQTVVNRAANNRAPTMNSFLPVLKATTGSAFSFTVPGNAIVDPDPWDSITYKVEMPDGSALPAWLSFDPITLTISGTPGADHVGELRFHLLGSDNYGAYAGQVVLLNIGLPNRAPVLSSQLPDQAVFQGSMFIYTLPPSAFTDPDAGDTLSYSVSLADGSALPPWLIFDGLTRTFSGTPHNSGTTSLRVTVKDSGNLTVSDAFDLVVTVPKLLLNGTAGADTLTGSVGSDSLYGGEGNDLLNAGNGADLLAGGAGNDTLNGGGNTTFGGSDTYLFDLGGGVDTINETYDLYGFAKDVLKFGAGINPSDISVLRNGVNLELRHFNGADKVIVNNWFTSSDSRYHKLEWVEFADLTKWDYSQLNEMALSAKGTGASESLYGIESFGDVLSGLDGNDILYGLSGADALIGGAGDDQLNGGSGDDILAGGIGNDTLNGSDSIYSNEANTYLFDLAGGVDTIYQTGYNSRDVLKFGAGIKPEDISVVRDGVNLEFRLGNGTDRVIVHGWFYSADARYNKLERVDFSNGAQWNQADLAALAAITLNINGTAGADSLNGTEAYGDVINGFAGNDTLIGLDGDDTLAGGFGNDILYGDGSSNYINGSDTYLFGLGDGVDTVIENQYGYNSETGDIDVLKFGSGINPVDIRVVRTIANLEFRIINRSDKVIVRNWFESMEPGQHQLERIEFANGVQWHQADLVALAELTLTTNGTAAANTLFGTSSDDVINGLAGNDILDGGFGNDNLAGGLGSDSLYGGEGGDHYQFDLGWGIDTIFETVDVFAPDIDVLKFGAGINPGDINIARSGANLEFRHANGVDKVVVSDWLASTNPGSYKLERVDFADGRHWGLPDLTAMAALTLIADGGALADTLIGSAYDDVLNGLAGNDLLEGGDGSDTYLFNLGSGVDTIVEAYDFYGVDIDVLTFGSGINSIDISVARVGNNLELSHINGADKVIFNDWFIYGASDHGKVERLDFVSGDQWTRRDLMAALGLTLSITGTPGADTLFGGAGYDNIILGLAGDDLISGDGSSIQDGGDGNDRLNGAADSDDLNGGAGADSLKGFAGNDILNGDDGNDLLDGGLGNDILAGGRGNDTLNGDGSSSSNDSDTFLFNLGDGLDTITDTYYGRDELVFGAGIASSDITVVKSGNNLEFRHTNGMDKVIVNNWFNSADARYNKLERVVFLDAQWMRMELLAQAESASLALITQKGAEGADTLVGTINGDILFGMAGNDLLLGKDGNDTLAGGFGNDTLNGGEGSLSGGSDTYLFDLGGGIDIIVESSDFHANTDVLKFGAGIKPSDIVVARNGVNLELRHVNGTDKAIIIDWFSSTDPRKHRLEWVDFVDGTQWTKDQLTDQGLILNSTVGADALTGSVYDETIRGLAGNDSLVGNAGNDHLMGDDGNDFLDGGDGNDTLAGGFGNDTLIGGINFTGGGSDTYLFNLGSRIDSIIENFDSNGEAIDILMFGSGITPGDISLVHNLSNLELRHANGTDKVIVNSWFTDTDSRAYKLERVDFADGRAFALNALQLGSPGSDNLLGQGDSSVLMGDIGNDTLSSGYGDDWLNGGGGTDSMFGGPGDDTYIVDNTGDTAVEFANEGTDTIESSLTWTLGGNLENLVLSGESAINGSGNALNNRLAGNGAKNTLSGLLGNDTLHGGAGNDWLVGGAGADVLDGGEGMDTASYSGSNLAVTVDLALNQAGGGHAEGDSFIDIEHLRGSNYNDMLIGNAGNNSLNGGAGMDTLIGGAGNDTYLVEDLGDTPTEQENAGTDTVQSTISWTLGANLEKLALTGTASVNGFGNGLANTLTGNEAANTLDGLDGNDTLSGAAGADILRGGIGNDWLVGGAGADLLDGGLGSDTASYSGSNLGVAVNLALGHASGGHADGDSFIGIEHLRGSIHGDTLIGNSGNNSLVADSGGDQLQGGAGNDNLQGGLGNDTYLFNRGDGVDAWIENDATFGNLDIARFGADIAHDQLWFRKIGNDLETRIIGTSDRTLVKNWYNGDGNHIERFEAGDGRVLLDSQLDALVLAMADFTPPAAGQTTLPSNYHDALAPVLAANWQ